MSNLTLQELSLISKAVIGNFFVQKNPMLQDNGTLLYSKKEFMLYVSKSLFERMKLDWEAAIKEEVKILILPELDLKPSEWEINLHDPKLHQWKHPSQQLMHW